MRFSLRTLFVLTTLCCLYLSWQYRIVAERRAVVRWTQATYGDDYVGTAGPSMVICQEDDSQLTWLRCQMGDASTHWSCILPPTEQERARIFAAFPQAVIYIRDGRKLRPTRPVTKRTGP